MKANAQALVHQLGNGITILGQEIPSVRSAAISFLLPCGVVYEPSDQLGISSVLIEMLNKGAGEFDSRQLSAKFEDLGAQRSSGAGVEVAAFTCSALADSLPEIIDLYGKLLRQPTLPEDELESVIQLALQELVALEDEPSSKVMVQLAEEFYPEPFGRCQLGTKAGLEAITIQSLRAYHQKTFIPSSMIIGVAGKFDWSLICKTIERHFGDWAGTEPTLLQCKMKTTSSVKHLAQDSAQVQIALAYPSVPLEHPEYYTAKVAVGVLSGGMSGRLFIEVREKRGLVYRVSASQNGARGRGAVFSYAGTTPENAEQTLSVMLTELRNVGNGVSDDELKRSKADLKSRLVMQSESSASRASQLVNDWWNLKRIRTISEIKDAIDRVTSADIVQHMSHFPVSPVTLVTLGPKALQLPVV